jgi:proteasome lid subunit RPN8/RPN11
METWTSKCGTYTVVLEESFIYEAAELARKHAPREIGSALLGRYSADGKLARIVGTAPVPPDSKSYRYRFIRGTVGLREFFDAVFAKTFGQQHYVGEWHSHPGGAPTPSRTDNENQEDIARDAAARCPECILVLVALQGDRVARGVFVYSNTRGRVSLERRPPA